MSRFLQDLTLQHSGTNTVGTIVANYRNHRSEGEEWKPLLSTSESAKSQGGKPMAPVEVSAMFAAYVWFAGRNEKEATAGEEAIAFARNHGQAFLPYAHKGLGQLLIRIAGGCHRRRGCERTTAGSIAGRTRSLSF